MAEGHLQRAVLRRMGELNRIGESKRDARATHNATLRSAAHAAGTPAPKWAPSPHIHGIETMKQYTKISLHYAAWLEQAHPDTRKLTYAHAQGYDREYIQARIDRGLSAWTVARDTAALAKLHGCTMPEVHPSRPARLRGDIQRGRGYSATQYEADINQFGAMAEICGATGVRECELKTLTPANFQWNANGNLVLHLDGKGNNCKGGRSRDVEILPQNQKRVQEIISGFQPNAVMFPAVSSRLNVHGIRATVYAQSLYNACARSPASLKGQVTADAKGRVRNAVYHCRDRTGVPRCYDRQALLRVSRSLGHERENVVAAHYLL